MLTLNVFRELRVRRTTMTAPYSRSIVSTLSAALIVCALKVPANAKGRSFQEEIYSRAEQASWAAIPIDCWSDFSRPEIPQTEAVVGTGFLVNQQGYFITAAHVAQADHVGPDDHPIPCKVKAVLRQRDGSGFSQQFDVVELDKDHDLALCRILGFQVGEEKHFNKLMNNAIPETSQHPFSSLALKADAPKIGELVLVSGFPLGSYTSVLQLGILSATRNVFSGLPRTPKDGGALLQIAVSGNHGDSGAPVVDVDSGRVLGVILQVVPAPLAVGGMLRFDMGDFQNSGIMLAAPASWVGAILVRHGLNSEAIQPGRFVCW